MAKKVVNHAVTVMRDGQSVYVKPNTPFDFTAAEIRDILNSQPGSIRNTINEDAGEVPEVPEGTAAPKFDAVQSEAEAKAQAEADDKLLKDAQAEEVAAAKKAAATPAPAPTATKQEPATKADTSAAKADTSAKDDL